MEAITATEIVTARQQRTITSVRPVLTTTTGGGAAKTGGIIDNRNHKEPPTFKDDDAVQGGEGTLELYTIASGEQNISTLMGSITLFLLMTKLL